MESSRRPKSILTAEGIVEAQRATGKIPAEVAAGRSVLGLPVIAGALGKGYVAVHEIATAARFAIACASQNPGLVGEVTQFDCATRAVTADGDYEGIIE